MRKSVCHFWPTLEPVTAAVCPECASAECMAQHLWWLLADITEQSTQFTQVCGAQRGSATQVYML